MRALMLGLALATAPLTPALAEQRQSTDSAAAHHGVNVQEIVSPSGVHAWLVSDSTVPMIVMRAYWRGG